MLKKDDKMTINFQTDVGGDMKVDFWITDPWERTLNTQHHATMGEFSFDASRDGKYTYCFLNVRYIYSARPLLAAAAGL